MAAVGAGLLSFGALSFGALAACRGPVEGRAEARCYAACRAELASRCSDDACVRGCRFVIDRLVEREDRAVFSCMSAGHGVIDGGASCDDVAWATCAARVGIHADGGPPVPPPLPEDRGEEDEEADADGGAGGKADSVARDAGRDASIRDAGKASALGKASGASPPKKPAASTPTTKPGAPR